MTNDLWRTVYRGRVQRISSEQGRLAGITVTGMKQGDDMADNGSTSPLGPDLERRALLRRSAAIGAALWVAPAVTVLSAGPASADHASPVPGPTNTGQPSGGSQPTSTTTNTGSTQTGTSTSGVGSTPGATTSTSTPTSDTAVLGSGGGGGSPESVAQVLPVNQGSAVPSGVNAGGTGLAATGATIFGVAAAGAAAVAGGAVIRHAVRDNGAPAAAPGGASDEQGRHRRS